ncbi:MAG: hypothetical protein RI911_739 [Candidatus Parcubacteria bacterium]
MPQANRHVVIVIVQGIPHIQLLQADASSKSARRVCTVRRVLHSTYTPVIHPLHKITGAFILRNIRDVVYDATHDTVHSTYLFIFLSKIMAKKAPITPVGKRILVKQAAAEEKTKSGLIIPDAGKKDRPERGEVIAIGEALAGVAVGDIVYFGGYDNQEIELDDETYLLIKHDNISGVLKK